MFPRPRTKKRRLSVWRKASRRNCEVEMAGAIANAALTAGKHDGSHNGASWLGYACADKVSSMESNYLTVAYAADTPEALHTSARKNVRANRVAERLLLLRRTS